MWFIYWLSFIFGGVFILFQMGNGNWILSAILLGIVFLAVIIYETIKSPKDILKIILSSILGFTIAFGLLAFVSQMDPDFVESQVEYIQGNH